MVLRPPINRGCSRKGEQTSPLLAKPASGRRPRASYISLQFGAVQRVEVMGKANPVDGPPTSLD